MDRQLCVCVKRASAQQEEELPAEVSRVCQVLVRMMLKQPKPDQFHFIRFTELLIQNLRITEQLTNPAVKTKTKQKEQQCRLNLQN